ncbi:MAG TPA: thiamine ABC transporter ATP-binding protein [Hypericibacter adhaerens]|uniref:thiamine ABC transporter ATP-binding protein n=1 Tax=Hypericibacter adhaerens TaxID=2602016 RepID=UPI002D1DC7C4|nr:thiamine ABC transporter ATP-binding protein [Hypericibacter adhaerens]HWA46298.1 thiamine ABC transporter ATP-binding protein [Hypericibacter adhaerens]
MLAVEMTAVTFRYEAMLMRFDLAVQAGESLAIIGPSGAGKSTLLNLVAGFETPLAGSIKLAGLDMAGLPPAERPVTMVFQEHNLFAHLPLFDNVALGIDPGLRLKPGDSARVEAALAEVGLTGLGHRKPEQVSGGERQRAALARALVRNRPLLLLDEPFAALGPKLRREMLDLVNALRRGRGLTVLFVSHQPEDARHGADRVAFVQDGQIRRIAATADFFAEPRLPEIAAYLGEAEG